MIPHYRDKEKAKVIGEWPFVPPSCLTGFEYINRSVNDLRNTKAWTMAKRLGIDALRRNAASFASRGKIPLMWCEGRNWGDALSPYLVRLLSGKEVVLRTGLQHRRFLAIGSILGAANGFAEVWGSGFIHENDRVVGVPRKVHAVRGPFTRDLLLRQGVDCPEVYGDPALLLPRFFNPDSRDCIY